MTQHVKRHTQQTELFAYFEVQLTNIKCFSSGGWGGGCFLKKSHYTKYL